MLVHTEASACGFFAGQLPPGTYAFSCTNCTIQGPTLECDCLRVDQTLRHTSINVTNCRTEPANDNGSLVCSFCSTVGGCCLDGACTQQSYASCQGGGGAFQGDGKSCAQVTCPTKTGWKKLAYTSRAGALRTLKLGQAKKKPGTITLGVKALLAGVDPATLALPLTARITLDPASVPTTLCGQVAFTGPAGVNPVCAVERGALGCRIRKRR